MNGPSEELRREIRSQIDEISVAQPNGLRNVTPQTEARLADVLSVIIGALEADVPTKAAIRRTY